MTSVPLAFRIPELPEATERPQRAMAARAGAGSGEDDSHSHGETHPWEINIPDHPKRAESAGFRASKKLVKKILASIGVDKRFLGSDSLQMHHGGSLWVFDDQGWFMLQNEAGIEWSGQFCADPAKVEFLRLVAKRLYAGFPKSIPEMVRLGYRNAQKILDTPIVDKKTVAVWVDSIFNSCIPLPAVRHVGVLPAGGGRHHYPTPITDIELVKFDDFVLWVTDPVSHMIAAVVPVAARGEGVSKVAVVFAVPGTALADRQADANANGDELELDERASLTRQAFARQGG
jgi:hypothetical protein